MLSKDAPIGVKYTTAIAELSSKPIRVIGSTEDDLEIDWMGQDEIPIDVVKLKIEEILLRPTPWDTATEKLKTLGFADEEIALLITPPPGY